MISYKRLWCMMEDKGLNKTDVIELADISTQTYSRMRNNQPVNLKIIDKLCASLSCSIDDIIEYVEPIV